MSRGVGAWFPWVVVLLLICNTRANPWNGRSALNTGDQRQNNGELGIEK
jgi:hypothetical protein